MSGPLGGQPGAAPRGGKGPGQRRMLLKGLKMGSYVLISYREKKGPGYLEEKVDYEGTIADKRVGWDNRESYVELKECTRLSPNGEIAAREGTKRLIDAFIEDCEIIERMERPLSAELAAAEGGVSSKDIAGGSGDAAVAGGSASEVAAAGVMAGNGMMPMMMPFFMAGGGGMPMGMPMAMGAGMPMGMAMPCMMPMGMGFGGMMAMPMVGMGGAAAAAAAMGAGPSPPTVMLDHGGSTASNVASCSPASTGMMAFSGTTPGFAAGMTPGMLPNLAPSIVPGMAPGIVPGMMPCMAPGMVPPNLAAPGMAPGMAQGMVVPSLGNMVPGSSMATGMDNNSMVPSMLYPTVSTGAVAPGNGVASDAATARPRSRSRSRGR